jgi:hypothetical protein
VHKGMKQLVTSAWEPADRLRANSELNATEYSIPVVGLIFLPEKARYDELADLPKGEDLAQAINRAEAPQLITLNWRYVPQKRRF